MAIAAAGARANEALGTALAVRHACRAGAFDRPRPPASPPGHVQGNLAILPQDSGCRLPALLPAQSEAVPAARRVGAGRSALPAWAPDLDIRTDLPRYRVWRDGELVDEPTDIARYWRDDLVTFVIGCSFSFEEALLERRRPAAAHRARRQRADVPHRRSPAQPAGPFHGPAGRLDAADDAGRRDPRRPDHLALSRRARRAGASRRCRELIGIADLAQPDYGDAVEIEPGELPVFWACGVTPQAVIAAVRPAFCHHACAGRDAGRPT